jgi:aldehyde dehydrogenase (NAD+)
MIDEIGKTTGGAVGEVLKTVKILEFMGGLGTHTRDDVIYADQPGVHMYTRKRPVGVAAVVGPFNFPGAVPYWKTAPALVAGCTVVFKPSPAAPRTSQLIMDLYREAGVPAGVINLVHGGPDIVRRLVEHPDVQAVSFTGSTLAGNRVADWAHNRKPRRIDDRHVVCEMGGQNAVVVLRDANLDEAAQAIVMGGLMDGQRCTATSRVVAEEEIYDELMRLVIERTRALKIGPGRDKANQVGPLVSGEALDSVLRAIETSRANGMNLLVGGERLTDGDLQYGHFVSPTVLEGDPDNEEHLALRDEGFGPVVGACRVPNLAEAIRVTNLVSHRHAAAVYTESISAMHEFEEGALAGMIHARNPTVGGDPQTEFGGMGGDTSIGQREMGPHAMDPFLWDQTFDERRGGTVLAAGAR